MLFAIVSAFTFFAMGQYEARDGSRSNGLLWAALSAAVSWLVLSIFHGGMLFEIVGQVCLFAGIAVYRVAHEP